MLQPALPRMSVDEFLTWSGTVDGRHELVDGVPIAMAAERALHARTKTATFDALRDTLRLDPPGIDVSLKALFSDA